MVFSNNLLAAGASQSGGGGGYAVSNSAVFNRGDATYFSRTPSAGNTQKWTISFWVKLSILPNNPQMFYAQNNAYISYNENASGSARICLYITGGTSPGTYWETNATDGLFRDPNAWYHFCLAFDSTQSAADDRVKFYVNGVYYNDWQKYSSSSQNSNHDINSANEIKIGSHPANTSGYISGYFSEYVFIDDAQLAPTSFGEYDEYGVWKPIDVSELTFGSKGWYMPFSNADPFGTFGESNNGTLSINSINPNSIGYTFTAPSTTTLTAIQFQGVSGTSGNVDAYIYTNNSGSPGSVAKSLGTFATANAVFSITANFSMTAGTVYWIVLIPNGTIDQQLRTVSVSTANPIAAGRTDNGGAATTITVGKNMSSRNFRINLLTSAAGLGTDASGNGFNFTNNNSVSQSTDSPTQNHCTFNPLSPTGAVLSDGMLVAVLTGNGGYDSIGGTQSFPRSGKWYFEVTFTTANSVNSNLIGIADGSTIITNTSGIQTTTKYRAYRSDAGQKQSDLAGAEQAKQERRLLT